MATGLSRQFVWTVIPAGRVVNNAGLVSVLLTPRLSASDPTTLGNFGMAAWPQLLAATRFRIACGTGSPIEVQRAPYYTATGEAVTFSSGDQDRAWRAVFGANLTVKPYQATTYAGRPHRLFPAAAASSEVKTAYSDTSRVYLKHRITACDDDLEADLAEAAERWQNPLRSDAAGSALLDAYRFYQRDNAFTVLPAEADAAPPAREFHEVVAKLADHPLMLRALGLLLDFSVPVGDLNGADPKTLSVQPRWPASLPAGWPVVGFGGQGTDLSPKTAYSLAGQRFLPASADAIRDGVLLLNPATAAGPGRFDALGFDLDGAALRIVTAARSTTSTLARPSTLPALRSAGVSLVDRRRGETLTARIARGVARVASLLDQPLDAGDLIGGYRIDILDTTTGRWLSTCLRRAHYTVSTAALGPEVLEEGFIRPDAVTTGAGPNDALFVHEVVARWNGWSLAVRPPGRPMPTYDVPALPPAPDDLDFEVTPRVEPGSLPRLRFGRTYHMRVRIADLAGGGLRSSELASATGQHTLKFTHRRFEPLPPPEILPAAVLSAGETADKMVIDTQRTTQRRHILCPATSLEVALQHGMFDAALGPGPTDTVIDRSFAVAARADKTAADIPEAFPAGADDARYIVAPTVKISRPPWLSDPAAQAVHLKAKRPEDPDTGGEGIALHIPLTQGWAGTWPEQPATTLRLAPARTGQPCVGAQTIENGVPVITVELAPAEQVTLEIASCPGEAAGSVNQFGIADWSHQIPAESDEAAVKAVADGGNPLITPRRNITLVHAVQRPLQPPTGPLRAARDVGHTDARIQGLAVHIKSTGRINIHADWTDVDDTSAEGKKDNPRSVPVGAYPVAHVKNNAIPPIVHEFGDTRRRKITYRVTAVSRFEDCYRADADCTATTSFAMDVPSTARPPVPTVLHCVPTFGWTQEHSGDGSLVYTRRGAGVRVYLARPWMVSGADESLAVLVRKPTESLSDGVLPYLSLAGRDPVWQGPSIPAVLEPAHFNAPQYVEGAGERARPVMVYPVEYDSAGKRWYADVDLAPLQASAYWPFVRLAVARYQDNCVDPKHKLSGVTRTDPVPLLPDRTLMIKTKRQRIELLLGTIGPADNPRPRNTVTAELQVYDDGTGGTPAPQAPTDIIGTPGWITLASVEGKLASRVTLDIPDCGGRPRRILVTETETYPPPPDPAPVDGPPRLVYANVLTVGPDGAITVKEQSDVV